jgi:hypothetical protein
MMILKSKIMIYKKFLSSSIKILSKMLSQTIFFIDHDEKKIIPARFFPRAGNISRENIFPRAKKIFFFYFWKNF